MPGCIRIEGKNIKTFGEPLHVLSDGCRTGRPGGTMQKLAQGND
ncbi:hypothetical protein RC1_3048 [Rhodospirillum centenum SW]|uniref:Uncharacterized protein n=1 Tax=Rhodospirillum centenum (strain ATCC 51521 / SW) TaxID=414684 RepID=B6IVU0_RHOCS|nr:hypothetical protein RC1_3048 [Rhodospirillum centenum SW]